MSEKTDRIWLAYDLLEQDRDLWKARAERYTSGPPVSRVRSAIEAARAVHPHELNGCEKIAMARVIALLWEASEALAAVGREATPNEIAPVSHVRSAIEAALEVTQGVHPHELSAREKIAMARVVSLLWEAHDTIDAVAGREVRA